MALVSGTVSRDAIPSLLQPGVDRLAGTTGKKRSKKAKKKKGR